ncbi:MAG: arsenate reductase ArsC [Candidatus Marinimicrobia bacterium]|nr:arsenate reductase ArsC [Candidatus Neomarinimicrobiota bacterium]
MRKKKILVLCTGNACRSQMAEGWFRFLRGEECEVWSAGIHPDELDPRAVLVMKEAGVDISHHHSKHIDELPDIDFDMVITVCDAAREDCPIFPGRVKQFHQSFENPPVVTKNLKDEDEILRVYRQVRDDIKHFVETFIL